MDWWHDLDEKQGRPDGERQCCREAHEQDEHRGDQDRTDPTRASGIPWRVNDERPRDLPRPSHDDVGQDPEEDGDGREGHHPEDRCPWVTTPAFYSDQINLHWLGTPL
jgi:hypothetical protein